MKRAMGWGLVMLSPFVILEMVNRVGKYGEGFPFALFVFGWVLTTVAVWLFSSIKNNTRTGVRFLLKLMGLLFVGYVFAGWVWDQWPCFMGVPNCD